MVHRAGTESNNNYGLIMGSRVQVAQGAPDSVGQSDFSPDNPARSASSSSSGEVGLTTARVSTLRL
jgi:hypothetical protein